MDEERIVSLADEYDIEIEDVRRIILLASRISYLEDEMLDSFVEEVCLFCKGVPLEELILRLLRIRCEDALCIPNEKTDDEILDKLTGVNIEAEISPEDIRELLYRP